MNFLCNFEVKQDSKQLIQDIHLSHAYTTR